MCLFHSLLTWKKKKKCMHSITSHHKQALLQIDSLITMLCLFIGRFLTWRMFFRQMEPLIYMKRYLKRWPVCPYPPPPRTSAQTLWTRPDRFKNTSRVIEFLQCRKSKKTKKKRRGGKKNKSFYVWWRRKKGKPEPDQWAARLGSSVSRRVRNYDMYLPICRSHPPS